MKGYHVERRFGWDTHGVPIEYEIDKKLGMSGLQAVEKIGIEKYNEECKSIVMKFAGDWKVTIDRLGRWIDMEDKPYKVRQRFIKCGQLLVPLIDSDFYFRLWTQPSWNPFGGSSSKYVNYKIYPIKGIRPRTNVCPKLFDKDLVYRGYRVMPYSTALATCEYFE